MAYCYSCSLCNKCGKLDEIRRIVGRFCPKCGKCVPSELEACPDCGARPDSPAARAPGESGTPR